MTLTATELEKSRPASENEYGIDSAKNYPGTEVTELIAIIEEEAASSIADAYAEGFKAGKKEEAGNAAYWKSVADRYREQVKKPPWMYPRR